MIRTVVSPPDGEPVSLEAVKLYLRIGHAGEDALIEDLIAGARAHIEGELGVAIVERTLEADVSGHVQHFNKEGIKLDPGPVKAVLFVTNIGSDGTTTDVTSTFQLDGDFLCLKPGQTYSNMQRDNQLIVQYRTGFGSADVVPDDLQLATKMLVNHAYRARNGETEREQAGIAANLADLLAPYREVRL